MLTTQIVKRPLQIQVDTIRLSGLYAAPAEQTPRALLVALHGGGLSAGMFDVSVAGEATFLETAAGLGYAVIALDRPGYRASVEIALDQSTFPNQIDLLLPALQKAWEQYGGGSAGIHLVGHSIGGMIALCLAARKSPLPLIGVSTHSAGLVWQPGIPERLRSLITDAPHVIFPHEGRVEGYGPAWSWTQAGDEQFSRSSSLLPVAELRDALTWPQLLRTVSASVRIPVQITITEFDSFWSSAPGALSELAHLFTASPFVDVHRQRFGGHNLGANLASQAFTLRELAFVEECRIQALTASVQREEKISGSKQDNEKREVYGVNPW